jgi:hypothetical protein
VAEFEGWSSGHDIILNGEPLRGRTKRQHPKSVNYTALDLVELREQGSAMYVETQAGKYLFEKSQERDENGIEVGAMDGWVRTTAEKKVGADIAGRFMFLEPNPKGTSFLTPTVVLREGLEVGFVTSGSNVIESLGVAARILAGDDAIAEAKRDEELAEEIARLEKLTSTSI